MHMPLQVILFHLLGINYKHAGYPHELDSFFT